MKKLLPILLVSFCGFLKAQTYYQFFEGSNNTLSLTIVPGSTNIWQIGPPQKVLFSSASTMPNVIVTDTLLAYPTNNTSAFTFTVLNSMFAPVVIAVQWKQKLDMEAGKDGGIVEFSTNSGNTWQNAHNNPNVYQYYGFLPANKDTINSTEYCFSGTDSTWRDIWLCLSPSVTSVNDSIMFRFVFKSDAFNPVDQEGWMIDNLQVHKTILHPVKEISQVENVVVYPNVTSGIVNVEMKKKSETDVIQNIELFDNEGKLVESYGQNYTKVVLDISRHKPGIYYLNITVNKKASKFKVIYEKS